MPDFLNLFPDGDFHRGFSKKIIFPPIEIILILEKDQLRGKEKKTQANKQPKSKIIKSTIR